MICGMKHTKRVVTLTEAMARKDLTQQELEDASGIDRTWIAKLKVRDAEISVNTYAKLDTALRELKALRRGERLVFGPGPRESEAVAS